MAIHAGRTGLGSVILSLVHLDHFKNWINLGSGQAEFGL